MIFNHMNPKYTIITRFNLSEFCAENLTRIIIRYLSGFQPNKNYLIAKNKKQIDLQ